MIPMFRNCGGVGGQNKAWKMAKVRGAWGWLKGDRALQKSIMMMIRDEEVEMKRLVEEARRNQETCEAGRDCTVLGSEEEKEVG